MKQTCFFCGKKVSSIIAYEYQAELENKFDAWNIYLAFVTPSAIAKQQNMKLRTINFLCGNLLFQMLIILLTLESI